MGLLWQPLLPVIVLLACLLLDQSQLALCQSMLGTFAEVRNAAREQLRLGSKAAAGQLLHSTTSFQLQLPMPNSLQGRTNRSIPKKSMIVGVHCVHAINMCADFDDCMLLCVPCRQQQQQQ
jgi:hypothetical protein